MNKTCCICEEKSKKEGEVQLFQGMLVCQTCFNLYVTARKPRIILYGAYGFEGFETHGIVEKVIRPESGGIYTKLVGCDYLFKGHPQKHIMEAVAQAKKAFPTIVLMLESRTVKAFTVFLYLFMRKTFWKIIDAIVDLVCRPFWEYRLIPKRHCPPIRELHRVFNILISKSEKDCKGDAEDILDVTERLERVRDMICMSLSTDIAYRLPFQDIVYMIDKKKLRKNPVKEIHRVSDIFEARGGIEDNWRAFERLITKAIRFSKKARKMMIDFVEELDFDKIKLDEADWFFCLNRPNYKFRGVPLKERQKIRDEIYKREGKPAIARMTKERGTIIEPPRIIE